MFALAISVTFLHSLVPSHWLCFSLVAKRFGWNTKRLFFTILLANLIHITFLGVIIFLLETVIPHEVEETAHLIGSAFILALGLAYIVMHYLNIGHKHSAENIVEGGSTAFLMLSLILSPCNYVIAPLIYAASMPGFTIAVLIIAIFFVTVATASLLAYLSFIGLKAINLEWFDHNEKWIMGLVMIAVAVIMYLGETH